ncbi:MAG: hypothetical protein AAFY12_17765 [Pseudomonadota bacterium]
MESALLTAGKSPHGGRRNIINRAATWVSRASASGFAETHLIGTVDVALSAQHLTYIEMMMLGLLPNDINEKSFCVVRNPFDRALSSVTHFSDARWIYAESETERFDGFERDLVSWLNRPISDHNERAHRRRQIEFVKDLSGKIVIENILKFERLDEDFSTFAEQRLDLNLSLRRTGFSGRKRHYSDYISQNSHRIIVNEFSEDFKAFGYSC